MTERTYETKARLTKLVDGTAPTTKITINDRAATREAIFVSLKKLGSRFKPGTIGRPSQAHDRMDRTGTTRISSYTTQETALLVRVIVLSP